MSMRLIRRFLLLAVLLVAGLALSACSDDTKGEEQGQARQTLFVMMPWSGSDSDDGLYSFFLQNIADMKKGIEAGGGLSGCRLLVMLATSPREGRLFEITYENGVVGENWLRGCSSAEWLTTRGIACLLNAVKAQAPAQSYAMIVGGHGVGWTYKGDWTHYPNRVMGIAGHGANRPQTRFFGSVEAPAQYGIDIESLAEAIGMAGLKMQYILFDDCYMANVETAYALRAATHYLVGTTSEVMALGMPYDKMWPSLAANDYQGMTTAFINFYGSYKFPYGALSVVDCSKVAGLADIMRQVNNRYAIDPASLDSVQTVDGFSPALFYDMGDYVAHLCKDDTLKAQFDDWMGQVVRSCAFTPTLYSAISDSFIHLGAYSGLTISDESVHPVALKGKERTEWWAATH